jgi:hypothetical protein
MEELVLYNYLKHGLTTKALDKLLGYDPKSSKGWKSWKVLQNYKLENKHKGVLFVYSDKQARSIIDTLVKADGNLIDTILLEEPPTILEKYKNTYVLAPNEKTFYNILSGETRNIIRNFFSSRKKVQGCCQVMGCDKTENLDTVHFLKDRPEIFLDAAKRSVLSECDDLKKYDVYETMKKFLYAHSTERSVCFLCKEHHVELHRLEKSGQVLVEEFKRHIEW